MKNNRYRDTVAEKVAAVVAATPLLGPLIDLKVNLRAIRPAKLNITDHEFRIWREEEKKALKDFMALREEEQKKRTARLFPHAKNLK